MPHCAGCARDLRLVGIELDVDDRRREIRTFECDDCHAVQIKTSTQILSATLAEFQPHLSRNSAGRRPLLSDPSKIPPISQAHERK